MNIRQKGFFLSFELIAAVLVFVGIMGIGATAGLSAINSWRISVAELQAEVIDSRLQAYARNHKSVRWRDDRNGITYDEKYDLHYQNMKDYPLSITSFHEIGQRDGEGNLSKSFSGFFSGSIDFENSKAEALQHPYHFYYEPLDEYGKPIINLSSETAVAFYNVVYYVKTKEGEVDSIARYSPGSFRRLADSRKELY